MGHRRVFLDEYHVISCRKKNEKNINCKHNQMQKIVAKITNDSCKWQIVVSSYKLIGYKNLVCFKGLYSKRKELMTK